MGQMATALSQDVLELIRAIDEQQRKIQTVTANFYQKKETFLAQEPLLSSGLVKFKRPDQIYWQYANPQAMEIALDGKNIWMYSPPSLQVEKYSLSRGRRSKQSLDPLLTVFQKPFGQLAKDYDLIYEGLGGDLGHHFRLLPKEEAVKKILAKVDLWIDKTSGAIIRFIMTETNGDRLHLEFKNLQINPSLTDEDLQIKIPPNVRVLEQGSP